MWYHVHLSPFSKIIEIGSGLRPMNSLTRGSWPDLYYQTWLSSFEVDLKSNQKSIGYSHNIPTTILPMGTSCQPGNCFMSQGSQLVKTVDDISPPETYRAPSGTMKASQWGGGPPVCTNLISPCPMSKMCAVFCNRVLPSNSGGQPRATAVACVVWAWGIQDSWPSYSFWEENYSV